MSKKTLALIVGLILVSILLFVISLRSTQQKPPTSVKPTGEAIQPSPTVSVAHSVLTLSPNPIQVAAGAVGTVEVKIDPSDNPVTAVQLELSYDPKSVRNVQVTPGALFKSGAVIINKNNPTIGKLTYAVGITPSQTPISGTGVVAIITFTGSAVGTSDLTLLPTSLITARGVATSVLKSSTGTQVIVGSGTGGVSLPPTQSSPSAGL